MAWVEFLMTIIVTAAAVLFQKPAVPARVVIRSDEGRRSVRRY